MDIMELGAIGELVGGVAVIASLVYLAVQVRQASKLTRAEMAFQVVSQFNDMHETALANPEVISVLLKVESGEALTPLEERTFRSYAARLMNTWNGLAIAYEEGALSRFMVEQMNDDVVATCAQYPPLHGMLTRMFEGSPRLTRLPIYERLLDTPGARA